jgi:hypothetical protein
MILQRHHTLKSNPGICLDKQAKHLIQTDNQLTGAFIPQNLQQTMNILSCATSILS